MKKALLLTLFAILNCACAVFGQDNQSVLWEISGNGLKGSSFLFGTHHVASISLLDSFPQVMRIATSCDFALFETGGSHIGVAPPPIQTTQPPLDSLFTPAEYATVDSFFTASPYGSIRPHTNDADLWSMFQIALTMQLKDKNKQDEPFDGVLMNRLNGLNKPVFQLDNPKEVDDAINGLGYRNIAKMLVDVINDKTAFQKQAPEEIKSLSLYSKTLSQPLKLDEEVDVSLGKLTVDRNAHWVPKIEEKMSEGNCFIAVGFKHLQYKTGLIQLLKSKGYILRPVNL
ncbi:TraB/GumN family protein [Dyadobacter sp. BHUBP1]|uniref:TraB/GumN family protein n=1 Tax=Dyadobacter sp. BHUBP1 TaxID=3424178 RepID=UPI003D32BFDE